MLFMIDRVFHRHGTAPSVLVGTLTVLRVVKLRSFSGYLLHERSTGIRQCMSLGLLIPRIA